MAVNDRKAREMTMQLGQMEAAVRAAEARAERAEATVAEADARQTAATQGLLAEVDRLKAELQAREELRETNVKLTQEIEELRLGGRATKLGIADSYEEEMAMARLLWEMCGPTQNREVYNEMDVVQLDAVGDALVARLEAARAAYGSLVPVLWEHVARAQALAKALGVNPGLEQLAEEARREGVGPADVDRIARELARIEHAEQAADLAQLAATKSLAAMEVRVATCAELVAGLEMEQSRIEEENPGMFEPKSAEESAESNGKLTNEEVEAADLMRRLVAAREEHSAAVTNLNCAQESLTEKQSEHRRCFALMQRLRDERRYWREGPTLPERIAHASARQSELEQQYADASSKMSDLHKKIRWLWLDRLGHPLSELAIEYHERAPSELLSCSPPFYVKAERMVKDLETLVAQRQQDLRLSRKRIENIIRDLKTRQWTWSNGKDRLNGWQHDADLHALLSEKEPQEVDGQSAETARARLEWTRDREIRLLNRKQAKDAEERQMAARR